MKIKDVRKEVEVRMKNGGGSDNKGWKKEGRRKARQWEDELRIKDGGRKVG